MHRRRSTSAVLLIVAVFLFFGCTAPPPARPAVVQPVAPAPTVVAAAPPAEPAFAWPGDILPVQKDEPTSGEALAPVTWVIWGDYECPFTAKLFSKLNEVVTAYGPKRLRVVWKHRPLEYHENARALAEAATTVFRLGGSRAFWQFSQSLLVNQGMVDAESLAFWAAEAGVDKAAFNQALAAGTYASEVDVDLALAKKIGVDSTPVSFFNGVRVVGFRSDETYARTIAEQLKTAEDLVAAGVPRERLYAAAVEKNYTLPPPKEVKPPPDTTTVWRVPLGKSPVRGKATALVTVVMFGDFQCLFCKKVQPVLEALQTAYGDDIRFVFKHNPLSFHPVAEPASQLAIEARVQGGDAKFWEAYKLLYSIGEKLTDQDLSDAAKTLGLREKAAAGAISGHKHTDVIDADAMLADELNAQGTPTFFINGRRLVGAQPRAAFTKIIDEEIVKAKGLVAAGTAPIKLYDALQKDAKGPPPFARIVVPAATSANPGKGAKGAKVVVQMFADLQCPFCKRVEPVLDELIAAFPGKVRVVYRHLPLPMHHQAQLAAEAAVEAFKQKGEAGFWAYTKLLEEDQSAAGLSKESLLTKAGTAGLDATRMRTALDAGTHRAAVKADADVAADLGITGTPTFAVNDYYVGGAQSLRRFKRAVAAALGPRVAPTPDTMWNVGRKTAPAPVAPAPGPFDPSRAL